MKEYYIFILKIIFFTSLFLILALTMIILPSCVYIPTFNNFKLYSAVLATLFFCSLRSSFFLEKWNGVGRIGGLRVCETGK